MQPPDNGEILRPISADQVEFAQPFDDLGAVAISDEMLFIGESEENEPNSHADEISLGIMSPDDKEKEDRLPLQRHVVARTLGLPLTLTKKITDELVIEESEAIHFIEGKGGRMVPTVWSTHLGAVRERAPAPENWTNETLFAESRGVSTRSIQRIISKIRDREEPIGNFGMFRGEDDVVPREYFDDAITAHIDQELDGRQSRRQERERDEHIEEEIRQFAEELNDPEADKSFEAETFEKIAQVFGADAPHIAMDVLFRLREDWNKKTLMPIVNSFLSEYLGDFIIKKGELDIDNLPAVVDFLDERDVQEALVGVLKRHCLTDYHREIAADPDKDDFDILADYFKDIRGRIMSLSSPEMDAVIKEVEDYYLSLIDIQVPEKFVESLEEGRPFPDLNQRINIREMQLQKRMLIADEPGMGKSASAILSKEILGAKCALIITPSVVFDENVWQDYLKDYFKTGQEPRVLAVDNVSKLQGISASDYDYIVISQSRMTADYCDQLAGIDFDMLIVDEAHNFKNIQDGVWSKNLLELSEKINGDDKYLMMLTATPVPNKVMDIALPLMMLYPQKFKQYVEGGDYKKLVQLIIHSDVLKVRGLLLPRMQVKRLVDSIEIPKLNPSVKMLEMGEKEKEVYEILLDEWELEARDKMRVLQQFLLNPAMLDATPDIPGVKATQVGEDLREAFKTKDKVSLYFNNYIEGVIKGTKTVIPGFNLPNNVDTYTIYGDISPEDRRRIMHRFQNDPGKMLLALSGQTVSVGVDLSAAQEANHYNEPWTETGKRQQIGRSHRPGRTGELDATTYIVKGTIEEGIHRYITAKHRAVEKLLYGIPLTDLERELVERSEEAAEQSLDVNSDLAEYYFSSQDRMNKFFAHIKEIGQEEFKKFLTKYGSEYAETYRDMTSRSYAANASRLSGSLIDRFIKDRGAPAEASSKPVILDLGSGPEMLRRHIADEHADNVISLDINKDHFESGTGKRVAAGLAELPIADRSVDYANLSLMFHYTAWQPSNNNFERLQALSEINRVLKPGGRAVFTLMYSLDLRDEKAFAETASKLGFELVEEASGQVQSGEHFRARLVTLQKTGDCPTDLEELIDEAGPEANNALRFAPKDSLSLRDSRKIVTHYTIKDKGVVTTTFNEVDQQVLEEEESILAGMENLRDEHTRIEDIPANEIISNGFARIRIGNRYVLFKRLIKGDGAVVFRNY